MSKPKVLDLFCGMGGLSSGFVEAGFSVLGVDKSETAGAAYKKYTSSKFIQADLSREVFEDSYDYVIGGPPCRPWSSVNMTNRGEEHEDYALVRKFTDNVLSVKPEGFILENVPPLRNDPIFIRQLKRFKEADYFVRIYIFRYSDFGASTARKRLFVVGMKKVNHDIFESSMDSLKRSYRTVNHAIGEFRHLGMGDHPDHHWPNLKTIQKYTGFYETGKYGWIRLNWNEPAPSFGNVMKTYTLHPDSDPRRDHPRVVSPLEVSRIMGFNHGFTFPEEVNMCQKYQMLADSVSPVFSEKIASAILRSSWNQHHRI
jgi:DNA (cytosine-5)-methyltransferase 1